jgi:hypothetical protein
MGFYRITDWQEQNILFWKVLIQPKIWFCGPFNLFPSAFIVVFNQQRKTVEMKDGLHKFKPVRQSHAHEKKYPDLRAGIARNDRARATKL